MRLRLRNTPFFVPARKLPKQRENLRLRVQMAIHLARDDALRCTEFKYALLKFQPDILLKHSAQKRGQNSSGEKHPLADGWLWFAAALHQRRRVSLNSLSDSICREQKRFAFWQQQHQTQPLFIRSSAIIVMKYI